MEQTLIHALFHVMDMGGETAREKSELLAGIILSNRLQALTNTEDMHYVASLVTMLKERIEMDLTSTTAMDMEMHEELIHAYVSLSKAVEYAEMTTKR